MDPQLAKYHADRCHATLKREKLKIKAVVMATAQADSTNQCGPQSCEMREEGPASYIKSAGLGAKAPHRATQHPEQSEQQKGRRRTSGREEREDKAGE